MHSARLLSLALCTLVPSVVIAQAPPFGGGGRVAYERAQRRAEPRSGGVLRYGWSVTKGAMFYGALGAGIGFLAGGPTLATSWGLRAAGGGALWRATLGRHGSGISKHSERAFAKADVQEHRGHLARKHYYKMKGVLWTALESGLISGAASGGLGLVVGGPGAVLPAIIGGGCFGTTIGIASGLVHGYLSPFLKRRSLGWSMSSARRALAALEGNPGDPALQQRALSRLHEVQEKRASIPRLSNRQARACQALVQRLAGLMQREPALAGLAAAL